MGGLNEFMPDRQTRQTTDDYRLQGIGRAQAQDTAQTNTCSCFPQHAAQNLELSGNLILFIFIPIPGKYGRSRLNT